MNSIERIITTIKGEKTDRPPLSLTLSLYGLKYAGVSNEVYYTDYKFYVKGQEAIIDIFEPDILFPPFALALEGAAFGSVLKFNPKTPPNIMKPFITSKEELDKLKEPDIENSPYLMYIRNSIKTLKSKYGTTHPIAGVVTSPIDILSLVLGIEIWLDILLFDKNTALKLLETAKAYFVKYANKLIEDGANFIVIPGMFCNPKIVTKEIVEKIAVPVFKDCFKEIKAPIVMHHGGNPILPFIEYYKEMPNVIGFLFGITDNMNDAVKKINKGTIVMGNIDGPLMCKMNEKQIETYVSAIMNNMKNYEHFIFATSGADISLETTPEQIKAIKKGMI